MSNNRRKFIKNALIGTGVIGLTGMNLPYLEDKKIKLGIISNSIKDEFQQNYQSALKKIADIGYTHLEGSPPDNCESVAEFKNVLDDVGIKSIGPGTNMADYINNMDKYLKMAETLESEYLVCYYPWMSAAKNLKMDEVMETAERINKVGKQAKNAGFRFAWHNHAKEFVDIDHRQAFDILLENTDPEYSTIELDWFWVKKGKHNPIDIFNKYPGRFELAHARDINGEQDAVCPGQGLLDLEKITRAARNIGGTKHFIVEHGGGMECARDSYKHFYKIM